MKVKLIYNDDDDNLIIRILEKEGEYNVTLKESWTGGSQITHHNFNETAGWDKEARLDNDDEPGWECTVTVEHEGESLNKVFSTPGFDSIITIIAFVTMITFVIKRRNKKW